MLDAATAGDEGLFGRAEVGEEAIDQRRLADTRLAGDEHHLPLTGPRAAQRGVERGEIRLALDERNSLAGCRRLGPPFERTFDWRDEAIALSRHGFDVALAVLTVQQGLPEQGDRVIQVGVF